MALFSRLHLGEEPCVHICKILEIYQVRTVHQANQNDWPKQTRKKCPKKGNSPCPEGQLSNSGLFSLSLPMYTFPPNQDFTCFTTSRLCGNSFPQSQRDRALFMTTGLVARICCFATATQPSLWLEIQAPLQGTAVEGT